MKKEAPPFMVLAADYDPKIHSISNSRKGNARQPNLSQGKSLLPEQLSPQLPIDPELQSESTESRSKKSQ